VTVLRCDELCPLTTPEFIAFEVKSQYLGFRFDIHLVIVSGLEPVLSSKAVLTLTRTTRDAISRSVSVAGLTVSASAKAVIGALSRVDV
jgi:hypothetical protein